MTAAATTGPAKHPRPTSSQPASILSSVKADFSTYKDKALCAYLVFLAKCNYEKPLDNTHQ